MIILHHLQAVKKLTGRKKTLKPTAVTSIFFWKQGSPVKMKSPKKRSPVKRKILAKGSETSTANAANANIISTCGLVTVVAISEEIDETSDPLEFDDRGTQDGSMSELKKEMEELKTKLEEEKAKTNALLIEVKEMKQQLVNLRTRCDNFENKSFSLNRFKNGKVMGFYTGFTDGEIFDALYNFCDSGEDGENIRYWHSSSTDQDMTVLSENDKSLESFPKPGRPRLLHPKEELFITLCRLRQGFPEEHLAHLYGVSQTTTSRIIITWVNLLYLRLKDVPMWLTREMINKHMPEQFKEKYPFTRIIIDCTEVKCQMPCSLRLNRELFSSYKNHTTL